jgi:hypothetical protein
MKEYEQEILQEGFDDIQDLYVGPVQGPEPGSGLDGQIEVDGTLQDSKFWGELLLYGHFDGDEFKVERLRRVALYGVLVDPGKDDPIGVLSLVGPLQEVRLEPGAKGEKDDVQLQLHYDYLTDKYEPLHESQDAVFPQVEEMKAKFTWKPGDKTDENNVLLKVTLDAYELTEPVASRVGIVLPTLDVLEFSPAGSGSHHTEFHMSLWNECPPPPSLSCEVGHETMERRLPIRFVSFSKIYSQALNNMDDLIDICNEQLGGVCQVWRNKGALDLRVEESIIEADVGYKGKYASVTKPEEKRVCKTPYASPNHVEVYLVDRLVNRPGGGVSHNCGKGGAYCILDLTNLSSADPNPRLLAHELGHLLGLDHPGSGYYPGSSGSVMEPEEKTPEINSLYNCRIFTVREENGQKIPLNPQVQTTDINDCFHPDE